MSALSTLRAALLVVVLALLACGCDYPPSVEFVEDPLPPALTSEYEVQVTQGTGVPVVFIANDHSKLSGASAGTGARSRDESIARVVPTTRRANVHFGAELISGQVFLVYGIAAGETEVQVLLDGEDKGTLPLKVVLQDQ